MGKKIDSWWKKAVIYQIYPKSFQDTNGDGIGDLKGIVSRLDYLKELGIDAIWISPIFKSPQDDNGYDISDYQGIDPLFGNMDDMDELLAEANKRNIRIILDLVLNHSSDEHPWFIEAKKSKDNPYHDYYVWRDGEEGVYPNDMTATFGGPAWEWVPELGQYYFHQFSVKQPDLNWENEKVREELYSMIRWWVEKGAGGFRLDVIDQIAKEPDLEITMNGPRLHEYLQELSREAFIRGDLITVGEAWGANTENAKLYSAPDGSEFSMVFQFEHICLFQMPDGPKWNYRDADLLKLKEAFARWQAALYGVGWNSLFWNNHDLPRIVSAAGNDKEYRELSAKMLATVLHGMQGTPYIFQGEELGMTNVDFQLEDYRDIESINMYRERLANGYEVEEILKPLHARSRDNARTPMQWDDSENAGFSKVEPWIKVNPNYVDINAKAQVNDENSIFNYYKKLISLRKTYDVFADGKFELLLKDDKNIFAYKRETESEELVMIANFYGNEVTYEVKEDLENMEVLIQNYEDQLANMLRPYEARMYYRKK